MRAEAAVEVLVAAGALGEPGWDGTQPKNPPLYQRLFPRRPRWLRHGILRLRSAHFTTYAPLRMTSEIKREAAG